MIKTIMENKLVNERTSKMVEYFDNSFKNEWWVVPEHHQCEVYEGIKRLDKSIEIVDFTIQSHSCGECFQCKNGSHQIKCETVLDWSLVRVGFMDQPIEDFCTDVEKFLSIHDFKLVTTIVTVKDCNRHLPS